MVDLLVLVELLLVHQGVVLVLVMVVVMVLLQVHMLLVLVDGRLSITGCHLLLLLLLLVLKMRLAEVSLMLLRGRRHCRGTGVNHAVVLLLREVSVATVAIDGRPIAQVAICGR